METIALIISGVSFAVLGIIGLCAPTHIARYFGNGTTTIDQRNELRAVYGGLPLALSLLGFGSLIGFAPLTQESTLLIYAFLLFGMASGRIVSFCLERPTRRSYVFFIAEVVIGGIALYGFMA